MVNPQKLIGQAAAHKLWSTPYTKARMESLQSGFDPETGIHKWITEAMKGQHCKYWLFAYLAYFNAHYVLSEERTLSWEYGPNLEYSPISQAGTEIVKSWGGRRILENCHMDRGELAIYNRSPLILIG